jgi:hypothetical protein
MVMYIRVNEKMTKKMDLVNWNIKMAKNMRGILKME